MDNTIGNAESEEGTVQTNSAAGRPTTAEVEKAFPRSHRWVYVPDFETPTNCDGVTERFPDSGNTKYWASDFPDLPKTKNNSGITSLIDPPSGVEYDVHWRSFLPLCPQCKRTGTAWPNVKFLRPQEQSISITKTDSPQKSSGSSSRLQRRISPQGQRSTVHGNVSLHDGNASPRHGANFEGSLSAIDPLVQLRPGLAETIPNPPGAPPVWPNLSVDRDHWDDSFNTNAWAAGKKRFDDFLKEGMTNNEDILILELGVGKHITPEVLRIPMEILACSENLRWKRKKVPSNVAAAANGNGKVRGSLYKHDIRTSINSVNSNSILQAGMRNSRATIVPDSMFGNTRNKVLPCMRKSSFSLPEWYSPERFSSLKTVEVLSKTGDQELDGTIPLGRSSPTERASGRSPSGMLSSLGEESPTDRIPKDRNRATHRSSGSMRSTQKPWSVEDRGPRHPVRSKSQASLISRSTSPTTRRREMDSPGHLGKVTSKKSNETELEDHLDDIFTEPPQSPRPDPPITICKNIFYTSIATNVSHIGLSTNRMELETIVKGGIVGVDTGFDNLDMYSDGVRQDVIGADSDEQGGLQIEGLHTMDGYEGDESERLSHADEIAETDVAVGDTAPQKKRDSTVDDGEVADVDGVVEDVLAESGVEDSEQRMADQVEPLSDILRETGESDTREEIPDDRMASKDVAADWASLMGFGEEEQGEQNETSVAPLDKPPDMQSDVVPGSILGASGSHAENTDVEEQQPGTSGGSRKQSRPRRRPTKGDDDDDDGGGNGKEDGARNDDENGMTSSVPTLSGESVMQRNTVGLSEMIALPRESSIVFGESVNLGYDDIDETNIRLDSFPLMRRQTELGDEWVSEMFSIPRPNFNPTQELSPELQFMLEGIDIDRIEQLATGTQFHKSKLKEDLKGAYCDSNEALARGRLQDGMSEVIIPGPDIRLVRVNLKDFRVPQNIEEIGTLNSGSMSKEMAREFSSGRAAEQYGSSKVKSARNIGLRMDIGECLRELRWHVKRTSEAWANMTRKGPGKQL